MSNSFADDCREGWCATVNLERTKAFSGLVDGAPKMIPLLPWSKDFEKDKFLSPDFTSLEVRHIMRPDYPLMSVTNFDQLRFSPSQDRVFQPGALHRIPSAIFD